MTRDKISNPPLNLVNFQVGFPNNLKIVEEKSRFYQKIKSKFPVIIFPETKSMTYDLSDCHFKNLDNTVQIRLGSNYYILEAIGASYDKYEPFWKDFNDYLIVVQKTFDLEPIEQVKIFYDNIIMINKEKVGEKFSDYLKYEVNVPENKDHQFITMDGIFAYKVDDGYIRLDVRLGQNENTKIWDRLFFKIECVITKQVAENANIKNTFDYAHKQVEDIFFKAITTKYYNSIK